MDAEAFAYGLLMAAALLIVVGGIGFDALNTYMYEHYMNKGATSFSGVVIGFCAAVGAGIGVDQRDEPLASLAGFALPLLVAGLILWLIRHRIIAYARRERERAKKEWGRHGGTTQNGEA